MKLTSSCTSFFSIRISSVSFIIENDIEFENRVKFSLTILLHLTDITIMFCSFSVLPEEGIDALNDQRGDN